MITSEKKKEIEDIIQRIDFQNNNVEKEVAGNLLEIIWEDVTLTRTQLKNRLLSQMLEKANTNFEKIISVLVKNNILEDTEIETKIRVIKKK